MLFHELSSYEGRESERPSETNVKPGDCGNRVRSREDQHKIMPIIESPAQLTSDVVGHGGGRFGGRRLSQPSQSFVDGGHPASSVNGWKSVKRARKISGKVRRRLSEPWPSSEHSPRLSDGEFDAAISAVG